MLVVIGNGLILFQRTEESVAADFAEIVDLPRQFRTAQVASVLAVVEGIERFHKWIKSGTIPPPSLSEGRRGFLPIPPA